MALRRIRQELNEIKSDPIENISIEPNNDDMFHWNASIIGPNNTPYQNGLFILDIHIPIDYPFKPPKIKFITKIYHWSIKSDGTFCIDILKDNWSPNLRIHGIVNSIYSWLKDPQFGPCPTCGDTSGECQGPPNLEIIKLFRNNKKKYNQNAKEWTQKYALNENIYNNNNGNMQQLK